MTHRRAEREAMVERQIIGRGVKDPATLAAMLAVPREDFVPESWRHAAYADGALPIEAQQTISQPYVVALMIEAAEVRPGDRVLEVGAGSGYAAAVISRIASRVFAIERHAELAALATERLRMLAYNNVEVVIGDGVQGLAREAPFEAILVAAAGVKIPPALKEQLALGGRLVIPVGEQAGVQRLMKIVRKGKDAFAEEVLGAVTFVPLVGAGEGGR